MAADRQNGRRDRPRPAAQPLALDPAVAARLKRNADGLVPAVAQQWDTGEVLMLGWMDDEALRRTLTTGRATYFSRSRQEYWRKGDTSGHAQWVREVRLDCDGDTAPAQGRPGRPGLPHRHPHLLRRRPARRRRRRRRTTERAVTPRRSAPSRPTSRRSARSPRDRRVIPVTRTLLADGETPVGALPQARGRAPRHLPARVGRERPHLVALLVRRRAQRRDADRARRRGGLARRRRRPASRPAATRSRRCAPPSRRCTPRASPTCRR